MNFEHYSWLLAIPVALVLAGLLFLANSRTRRRLVRQFASDRLVQQLLASYSPMRRKFKNGLLILSLALIILALARPQFGYTWRETKSKGIDIMFVVDVSRSMLARDIKPNRLARSKLAILDFLDKLEGDRVGLIAFAGNAFLQCPLTLDYDAFRQSLEAVDTDVISLGGTDIARAINETEAAFSDENNYKIMVLITDGEDLEEDGIQRAKEAAENGITIYTVGVGTSEGELIPVQNRYGQLEYLKDDNGQVVRTMLDADTLQEIAQVTEGFYTPLGPTGYGLEQVYEAGLESVPEHELSSRMQKVWYERFQWPLGIAIILLAWEPLIGTRRILLRRKSKAAGVVNKATNIANKTAIILLLAAFSFSSADLLASVREGEEYFRNGDYTAAANAFREAVEADPLNARASFNLGNTLQALGQPEQAQAAYMQALVTTDFSLQADAFYNLGSLRFSTAQTKLAETDLPAISEQSAEASKNSTQAIQQGQALLANANAQLADTADQQQKQQFLQQVQQVLQFAEQTKTASDEVQKAGTAAEAVAKPVSQAWEQSAKDFQSSLELNPAGEDAAHNFNYVQEQSDNLKRTLHELKRAQQQIKNNASPLEVVIEELKKLLEEQQQDQQNQDQQQQNQDQQQQDQQNQEQQDQQNQSGEQSGEQQDQQQQQSGEQQESGEEQQQQSGEQSEQGDEQKEKQSEGKAGEDEANSEQAEGAEEESEGEQEQGAERSSEEVDEMIKSMEEGEQSEEDATAPPPPTGEEKDKGESQSMRLSEEDAAKMQQEAARSEAVMQAEEAGEGQPEGELTPLGVMSRDDARRLLESLKRSEKKLPVSGYGRRESNRDEEGKRKDW